VNLRDVWSLVTGARSKWKFLEPSAPLLRWRDVGGPLSGSVWAPKRTDRLAPWPVPVTLWVETTTVFLGKDVERPLNSKEWAQLFDLRPEWGDQLRATVSKWRSGAALPIRFLVELGLAGARTTPRTEGFSCSPRLFGAFGRQLAPSASEESALLLADLRKYHGWVWDADDT
jgi:hypothetical protein